MHVHLHPGGGNGAWSEHLHAARGARCLLLRTRRGALLQRIVFTKTTSAPSLKLCKAAIIASHRTAWGVHS
eukprot:COSAG01_NODE_70_length_28755_cov_34.709067_1_plen_70_part_10